MGTVRLVSSVWDYIAVVQTVEGLNAPNGPVQTYNAVQRNWSADFTDKVCVRRSANPRDPNSGFTQWSCADKLTDGVYVFALS